MKLPQIIAVLFISTFLFSACNSEPKKATEVKVATTQNPHKIAFNISGMTCEIGCAKTIQSKLSKKAGITDAKIIFNDSLGIVEFDANQISAKEIETFVNGIAGGDLYKVKNTKEVALDSESK